MQPGAADEPLWGHLGLRLTGDTSTRWYPIGQDQAGRLIGQLRAGSAWIVAQTLNNRALLIQAAAVHRLVILDADADEPEGDWCVDWRNDCGYSQEVYRGLCECYLGSRPEAIDAPAAVRAEVRNIVNAHGLDEQALYALLRLTHVHYRAGNAAELALDDWASWAAFNTVQQEGDMPAMLHLACWARGLDFYAPQEQVALLDMPLHLMLGAAQDQLAQLREESGDRSQRGQLKRAA
jgi:hypothetical protein